jgi:hypothetical protein
MFTKPRFLATGIGSMPFADPEHAINISMKFLKDAPIWPQLPRLGFNEQMEIQYSENIPCAVVDRSKNRLYFNTNGDYSDAFAVFYESYISAMDPDAGNGDCSAMAMGPDYAHGLHALEKRLSALGRKLPFVKVQAIGPCSFALTIVDENKRALWYNEEFRDVVIKALSMKCRWQIQKFAPYAEKVICFIDEPILSAFGSSTYVSVTRSDVVAAIREVVQAIHADHALAGVHCCGNTEWSILIDAGVDIVNFDAFGFGETIAMYADSVKSYLSSGGMLAWGVVPTSAAIRRQTVDSLAVHLEKMMNNLAATGIDRQLIADQAIITPSCGTGSMDPQDAERVFELTAGLSEFMKGKFGF